MRLARHGILAVLVFVSTTAVAGTHASGAIGAGLAAVDTISDGHGPAGRATALGLDTSLLVDLTSLVRGGVGLGYTTMFGDSSTFETSHLVAAELLLQARFAFGADRDQAVSVTAGLGLGFAIYASPSVLADEALRAYGTMASLRIGYAHRMRPRMSWTVGLDVHGTVPPVETRISNGLDYWGNARQHLAAALVTAGIEYDL